jgi:hypothetical protein
VNYYCIMRCGLSVPMVSANTWLWRVMAMIDLCLHDGAKLRYPTCGESVQPLQSIKFIRIAVFVVSDRLWFGLNN